MQGITLSSNPRNNLSLFRRGISRGASAGSWYMPFNLVKRWRCELYWIVGGLFSWLIMPFIAAALTSPGWRDIISAADASTIRLTYILSLLWGIGGLTYGLGIRYLGMSLGNSVLPGITSLVGSLGLSVLRDIGSFVEYTANELSVRTNISELVRRACDQGLTISSYGTVSVRWYDNNFLITLRNVPRWEIQTKDIVQIKDGREPGKLPSRAVKLHQLIFKEKPDVNSIILTQSPNVLAFGVSQALLDVRTIRDSWIFLQDISVIQFGKHFSSDNTIGRTIAKNAPAAIIKNDSIVVTGDQLLQTFDRLEVAEFSAKSLI